MCVITLWLCAIVTDSWHALHEKCLASSTIMRTAWPHTLANDDLHFIVAMCALVCMTFISLCIVSLLGCLARALTVCYVIPSHVCHYVVFVCHSDRQLARCIASGCTCCSWLTGHVCDMLWCLMHSVVLAVHVCHYDVSVCRTGRWLAMQLCMLACHVCGMYTV